MLRCFGFALLGPCLVNLIALGVITLARLVGDIGENVDQARFLKVIQERLDLNILMILSLRKHPILSPFILNFLHRFSFPLPCFLRISFRWWLPLRLLLHHSLLNILLLHPLPPHLHKLFLLLCQLLPSLLLLLQQKPPPTSRSFFSPSRLHFLPTILQRLLPIFLIRVFDQRHSLRREALHDP